LKRGGSLEGKERPHHFAVSYAFFLRFLFFTVALLFTLQPLSAQAGFFQHKNNAPADTSARCVVPLGQAVGIKLFSQGVLVIGLSDIATNAGVSSPAKTCGIQEGDIITHINSKQVNTIEQVQTLLQDIGGKQMSVRVLRGDEKEQFTAQAVQCSTDGAYKLGAWIRDSMAGIGTLTFYDPQTGLFGTLGHGINDIDTAMLMPLQSGSIMPASVSEIKKGAAGQPGELRGIFQVDRDLGALYANTEGGVFGYLTNCSSLKGNPIPVATASEVHVGHATILSNITGNEVGEYKVEIIKLCAENADTRDLMLRVTDPTLLAATGGIVQGMSGSPILQDGKLVGAVTHVLVNDPTTGYGIFAENMLRIADTAKNEK
jgi:stage IV sporulation protein B